MKQQVISPRAVAVGSQQRLSMVEARHKELDEWLKQLGRHAYLTPAEQVEAAELKKLKLAAKDEIAVLRQK